MMSIASSLYMAQLAGKEANSFQQISKLIKLTEAATQRCS